MHQQATHQKHLAWLERQLEENQRVVEEVVAKANHLRSELTYLRIVFGQVTGYPPTSNLVDAIEEGSSLSPLALPLNDSERQSAEGSISEGGTAEKRFPKNMVRPDFLYMPLVEAVSIVLNDCAKPVNCDDVVRIAFDTRDDDEHERAKSSVSTCLRRGALEGRWKQVCRGLFVANAYAQVGTGRLNSEAAKGEDQHEEAVQMSSATQSQ